MEQPPYYTDAGGASSSSTPWQGDHIFAVAHVDEADGPAGYIFTTAQASWGDSGTCGRSSSSNAIDGEVLRIVEQDDRPIIDSGAIVSTCPTKYMEWYPLEVPRKPVRLQSVLGDPLTHYGTRTGVQFKAKDSQEGIAVNFEVTDATRAILSVKTGCDTGSLVAFLPNGQGGKVVRDTQAIAKITKILDETPGISIVHENGAYVLDVTPKLPSETPTTSSGRGFLFPVGGGACPGSQPAPEGPTGSQPAPMGRAVRLETLSRAVSQAEKEHNEQERLREASTREEVELMAVPVKVPPKPATPSKAEVAEHELTHCPFRKWCRICVGSKTHQKSTKASPRTQTSYHASNSITRSARTGRPTRRTR